MSEGILQGFGGISGKSLKQDGGISGIEGLGGVMSLTDTEIRKAEPEEKAYRLPDGKGRALYFHPPPSAL